MYVDITRRLKGGKNSESSPSFPGHQSSQQDTLRAQEDGLHLGPMGTRCPGELRNWGMS